MAIDMKWFNLQVKTFAVQRRTYEVFRNILQKKLQDAVRSMGILAIVQVRTKEIPSFAEKCIRKKDKYPNPAYQLTDLCGGRVIVETKEHIKPVCKFIEDNFEIDEAEDVASRLRAGEFGYLGVHYIVSLRDGDGKHAIARELLERWDPDEARRAGVAPGPKYKAEIQVRTLLQHAWASLVHDSLYKSEFKPPVRLERMAGKVAALLEESDDSFAELLKEVSSYKSYYGAYISPERIPEEIEILEAVRTRDRRSEKLAHRIARLAMAVEEWEKAAAILDNFKSSTSAPLLRDLGVAKHKSGDPSGLALIEKALVKDPADVDGHCELAEACASVSRIRASSCYTEAFRLAPTYPRALKNFIKCEIERTRNLNFLALVRSNLDGAIRQCREWARVGVHLPWAYFDMGFFYLLLDGPYESLKAYAKAVQLSPTDSPIREACSMIETLQFELKQVGNPPKAFAWVRRLLLLATVGKLIEMAKRSRFEAELAKAEADKLRKERPKTRGRKALDGYNNKLREAEGAASKATERCKSLDVRLSEAMDFLDKENLHEQTDNDYRGAYAGRKRVAIVAGGCDKSVEQRISEYRDLLQKAFEGYEGVIISGGTTAGVSGIVGNLPDNGGEKIVKIAYLPKSIPAEDTPHMEYRSFLVPGHQYSPLGPIQGWVDLLLSGVAPDQVRLIGINGGDISGFEYRLALVMGAKVGLLRESGREATRIFEDLDWSKSPGLIALPNDAETLRAFVQPPPQALRITSDDRNHMAREQHEEHGETRRKSLTPPDPALADWDELIPEFKESCLQQVDHIEEKLRRVGLRVRKAVEGETIPLFSFEQYFGNDYDMKIEEMARMEHARWNIERLLDGWTLGDRDPLNKTSPYLVSWEALPPDAKQWDRAIVTSLPDRLKTLGYEIYRP